MSDEEFESIVGEAIDALPEWVLEKLENIAFIVEDEPTGIQRRENELGRNETLFGLYEGVPLAARGDASPLLPDRITIFRQPILDANETTDDVRTCVMNTVWHEVAHYFGHDEAWIEEEERRRGKTR